MFRIISKINQIISFCTTAIIIFIALAVLMVIIQPGLLFTVPIEILKAIFTGLSQS
jgi:hypothetical protein